MRAVVDAALLVGVLIAPAAALAPAAAGAQRTSLPSVSSALASVDATPPDTSGRCHGEMVTAIQIRSQPPQFGTAAGVWRTVQNIAGHHHLSTRPSVVASFLELSVGKPCSEFRRAESERVLRAQPFLSSARVRAVPDSTANGVRIEVTTMDEVPLILGGRFHGAHIQALDLGDGNVAGRGVSLDVNGQLGHAYRDGIGGRLIDYAVVGKPVVAGVDLQRYPLGHLIIANITHPFYTDLQRGAWHTEYRDINDIMPIARPARDPLVLSVQRTEWQAGGVLRQRILGQVGGLGLVVAGMRVAPAAAGVVASDSGLVADTGVTLANRYSRFRVTRPAALAGIRIVKFVTVQGFNSLSSFEDLPSGVQMAGLVGRGLRSMGASDLFLSTSLYAGYASPGSYLALQVEGEGRRDYDRREWNDLITSGRAAWYIKPSWGKTLIVSDEVSGGSRPQLPLQLTLGSRIGGVRGYSGSSLAGAWRNVVSIEQRWLLASHYHGADVGIAGFADGGSLWAGGAPYGVTVPLRASFGVSLLGAYPSGSKRLLRVDFVVPTTHEGNSRFEVRFSVADLTRRFWREPGDIARSRTGPLPSSLFTWPSR